MLPHCSHLTHHAWDRGPASHHRMECRGLLRLQTKVHAVHAVHGVVAGPDAAVVPHDVLARHDGEALAGQGPAVCPQAGHADVGQPLLVLPLDAGEVGLLRGGLRPGPGEVVE